MKKHDFLCGNCGRGIRQKPGFFETGIVGRRKFSAAAGAAKRYAQENPDNKKPGAEAPGS
ncbi:hypothetical protein [Aminobacter sp. J44]|uniref:hypothetical protein n=1 Tax=Aminobacter sp. J44 TaxID=935262 RepID=UPI00119DA990|nr:hypothetical protein [Aminobacter sp. J44]